jgi:hypothetical protein
VKSGTTHARGAIPNEGLCYRVLDSQEHRPHACLQMGEKEKNARQVEQVGTAQTSLVSTQTPCVQKSLAYLGGHTSDDFQMYRSYRDVSVQSVL